MAKRKTINGLSKQIISKKIMAVTLDDFSLFGSLPFYAFVVIISYYLNTVLFTRLIYSLLLTLIIVFAINEHSVKIQATNSISSGVIWFLE